MVALRVVVFNDQDSKGDALQWGSGAIVVHASSCLVLYASRTIAFRAAGFKLLCNGTVFPVVWFATRDYRRRFLANDSIEYSASGLREFPFAGVGVAGVRVI